MIRLQYGMGKERYDHFKFFSHEEPTNPSLQISQPWILSLFSCIRDIFLWLCYCSTLFYSCINVHFGLQSYQSKGIHQIDFHFTCL